MNMKSFKHPNAPEIRQTRDPLTARALKAAGWREIEATVVPAKPEAVKK